MAIERNEPFEAIAPDDLLDLFRELGLPQPDPLWYVGRTVSDAKTKEHSSTEVDNA